MSLKLFFFIIFFFDTCVVIRYCIVILEMNLCECVFELDFGRILTLGYVNVFLN